MLTKNRHSRILRGGMAVILSILIVTVMMPSFAFSASESVSVPSAKGTIKQSGGVYVRSSSSLLSSVKTTLAKNKVVSVSSEKFTATTSTNTKYRWCYVPAYKGYVRRDMISLTFGSVKGTTTATVYGRSGAGTKYAAKHTFSKGETVTVAMKAYDKYKNKWYRVKYGSKYCFVLAEYVDLGVSTSEISAIKTTAKAYSKVSTTSTYGKVTASAGTVVRSSKSASSSSKGTLAKGTSLNISSESFNRASSTASKYIWYYSPTYKGYVKSGDVSLTYKTKKGHTTDSLNMRTGAGTGFSKSGTLASGATVYRVMNAYDTGKSKWYKIKYGSTYRYVSAAYVSFSSSGSSGSSESTTESDYEKSLINAGFPASYASRLATLHKSHPNWVFKAVDTGLTWSSAAAKQTASNGSNAIQTVYAPTYRSTDKGCYNYLKDTYTIRDGSTWVTASKKAVYYYMDPRNWLDETNIFMFEDNGYNSEYQTESVVEAVVQNNSVLYNNASLFINAGKTYDISPIYLAAKSYTELGGYTSMINGKAFTYGGVKYKKCYNAYNIGATDGANAAIRGLVYANGGSVSKDYARGTGTSNGRAWSSLSKAINGGASYLCSDYISNKQDTRYLEHFNVRNGLAYVGTHEYQTAVFSPKSMAYATSKAYADYGILDKKIVFYIPVYSNMPSSVCAQPSTSWSKDNNYYLKTLNFTDGTNTYKQIKDSGLYYTRSFTQNVANSVTSVTITALAAKSGATVTGDTGVQTLNEGTNKFTIKCKSSSGLTRTYTVTIVRAAS